jgi:hypothetical protein
MVSSGTHSLPLLLYVLTLSSRIGNNRSSSGTVSGMDVVSTITDSLYAQGTISSAVLGFSMQPTNTTSQANGELTFGGVDPSRYTGSIAYAPITKTFPSSYYFGVNASFGYGAEPMGLYNNAGIVDTVRPSSSDDLQLATYSLIRERR